MKRKVKYNNNRGAALISVMIAVTFITIVASALLYMAYMNFTMKAMSVESKSNFYETEGYLQGVTVKLQDEIARSTNPELTIADKALNGTDYDCKKLLSLKYPGSVTAPETAEDVAKYGSSAGLYKDYCYDDDPALFDKIFISGDGHVEKATSGNTTTYTLKGITITQETPDGLNNNIKTDLVYYVTKESTVSDKGGVGEFSMLADGALSCDNDTHFPSLTMYGNWYISSTYIYGTGENARSAPGIYNGSGGPALKLDGTAKFNVVGQYCVVYGDIHLTEKSVLTVSKGSNLTVYGDIYLDGDSALVCSGNLYMVDEALSDYGRPAATGIYALNGVLADHVYPSDLDTKIQVVSRTNFDSFCSLLEFNDGDSTNDGVVNHIIKAGGAPNGVHYYDVKTDTGDNASTLVNYNGKTVGWRDWSFSTGGTVNINNCNNRLNFMCKDGMVIDGSQVNATIISQYPVKINSTQHGIVLSKMGPEAFKIVSIKSTDTTNPLFRDAIHKMTVETLGGNYQMSAGDFFVDDPDDVVDKLLGLSVNNAGGIPSIISSVKMENWVKDSED